MDYDIIAVDFDGTLCKNAYPNIGEPNYEVLNYILDMKKKGNKVILWTCRVDYELDDAIEWCKNFGIEFDSINDNLEDVVKMFNGSNTRKIFADIYIDDKSKLPENVTDAIGINYCLEDEKTVELVQNDVLDNHNIRIMTITEIICAIVLVVFIVLGFITSKNKLDEIKMNSIEPQMTYIYPAEEPELAKQVSYEAIASNKEEKDDILYTDIVYEPQPIDINFDILKPCGYTEEELLWCVSDDNHSEMAKYIPFILKAEKKYGVNAFYLMCELGLESGWGKHLAGTNNLGGWMTKEGTYMDFDSGEECIFYIAEKLATDYKDITGTKLVDVCKRYSSNTDYAKVLMEIMEDCKEKIEEYQ